MRTLRAGVTEVDITPPIGGLLQGYGSRDHGAEGIHDSLRAQALVLDDGKRRVAIVACDLVGLEEPQVDEARRLAAGLCEIAPVDIMFCCSHTHGGPAMNTAGYVVGEPSTIDVTVRKLAGAVACSGNHLRPARVGFGVGRVRVGMNRREMRDGRIVLGQNPAGPIDPEVTVMRVDTEDGRPLAVLFSYACHGTTLGGNNYLITTDFVGPAREALLELIAGEGAVALFVNGTAGDINPKPPRGTFEAARRIGWELGAEAAKVWQTVQTETKTTLNVAAKKVGLPVSPPPPLSELRPMERDAAKQWAAVQKAGTHSPKTLLDLEWAREMIKRRTKGGTKRKLPCALQAIRIGELGIVGMPGEVLVEIGLQVKAGSTHPYTIPAAYANGRMGYIPTAKAVAEGGYEALSHVWRREQAWAPSVEQTITTASVDLLNSLA